MSDVSESVPVSAGPPAGPQGATGGWSAVVGYLGEYATSWSSR